MERSVLLGALGQADAGEAALAMFSRGQGREQAGVFAQHTHTKAARAESVDEDRGRRERALCGTPR